MELNRYQLTDIDGDTIQVESESMGDGVYIVTTDGGTFVNEKKIPEFIQAIYTAAGMKPSLLDTDLPPVERSGSNAIVCFHKGASVLAKLSEPAEFYEEKALTFLALAKTIRQHNDRRTELSESLGTLDKAVDKIIELEDKAANGD